MCLSKNPFAALMDPGAVLSACMETGALDALPVSARHSADRSRLADPTLERHDAELDHIYAELIAKASRSASRSKARA